MADMADAVDTILDVFDGTDRAELEAEILAEELKLAEEGVDFAVSISPEETGAYKDSIAVYQDGSDVGIIFGSEYANIIEYGSVDTPEYAIRARTEEHFNVG